MNIGSKEAIKESGLYPIASLKTSSTAVSSSQELEASFPARRQEARVNEQKVCAYSLSESLDGERLIIEQGEVYSLNRSDHGILVLMGRRPRNGQLVELHVAETRWEYSLNLYEVQWTQTVSVEAHGDLFLVGCRLLFEGSRYWAF
jgi:hypothetical protein